MRTFQRQSATCFGSEESLVAEDPRWKNPGCAAVSGRNLLHILSRLVNFLTTCQMCSVLREKEGQNCLVWDLGTETPYLSRDCSCCREEERRHLQVPWHAQKVSGELFQTYCARWKDWRKRACLPRSWKRKALGPQSTDVKQSASFLASQAKLWGSQTDGQICGKLLGAILSNEIMCWISAPDLQQEKRKSAWIKTNEYIFERTAETDAGRSLRTTLLIFEGVPQKSQELYYCFPGSKDRISKKSAH